MSRIADSCGFGVPLMTFVGERDQLYGWAEARAAKQGPTWRDEYQREKNAVSIDGLPGIDSVDSSPIALASDVSLMIQPVVGKLVDRLSRK